MNSAKLKDVRLESYILAGSKKELDKFIAAKTDFSAYLKKTEAAGAYATRTYVDNQISGLDFSSYLQDNFKDQEFVVDSGRLQETVKMLIGLLGGTVVDGKTVDAALANIESLDKTDGGIVENLDEGASYALYLSAGNLTQSINGEEVDDYDSNFKIVLVDNYNAKDFYYFYVKDGRISSEKIENPTDDEKNAAKKCIELKDQITEEIQNIFIYNGTLATGEL